MWPHPVAFPNMRASGYQYMLFTTEEDYRAPCAQMHSGFAARLTVFIVMFQEEDMVCGISPTYGTKGFFFFHLFKKKKFPEFLFNL